MEEAKLALPNPGVLTTVLGRIHRLFTDINYLKRFGPDTAFLCVTLAVITESDYLKNQVNKLILEPVLNTLKSNPENAHDMAIMISNSLLLFNQSELITQQCKPFIQLGEYDHDTYIALQEAEGYSYRDLLSGTVTTYFQSWAFTNSPALKNMWPPGTTLITPDEIVSQALDITYSRWYDMTTPLQFQTNKVLRPIDTNRDKIYFLTHVVFLSSHYGTRPVNTQIFTESEQSDIYTVLLTWFLEFTKKKAVYANLEETSEIAYTLLFLNRILGYRTSIPLELHHLVEEMTRRATKLTKYKVKKHSWYPKDNSEYDIYTDAHSLLVVSLLLVEMVRYQSYHSVIPEDSYRRLNSRNLQLNFQDPSAIVNANFQQLIRKGYVSVPAQSGPRKERGYQELEKIIQQLIQAFQKNRPVEILVRVPPKPEKNDIFHPRLPAPYTDFLRGLHLPDKFWSQIRERLARVLGLPKRRIRILSKETYLRLKHGARAQTKPHCDLFYFLRETDALSQVHPGYSTSPLQKGKCHLCRNEEGQTFKYTTICPDCVRDCLPIYTAWLSLGDFDREEHSLLEFVPESHFFPGFDAAIQSRTAVNEGLLPLTTYPENDWCYPSNDHRVGRYDLLIFNCKTIHRAKPPKKTSNTPRMSMDIRFIILSK